MKDLVKEELAKFIRAWNWVGSTGEGGHQQQMEQKRSTYVQKHLAIFIGFDGGGGGAGTEPISNKSN